VEESIKEDLHTIRKTSDELRQYITSILHLTRVEARDVKLNKEVCDINIIVNEALQRLAPLAKEKNIQILFTEEPLFSMELDKALITEVLINLVENAIKYSDRGKTIAFVNENRRSVLDVSLFYLVGYVECVFGHRA
jgi:signal transduction histidine kinase